jgi:pimeloyl-ACP methyl ester carboxylesterase
MGNFLTVALLLFCSLAFAEEQLINLPIEGRENDHAPVLQNKKSTDAINLILIPGGNAGTGEVRNGIPSSLNFLVRSRGEFDSAGFNTYILFRARSVAPNVMSTTYRNEKEHMKEIQSLINHIASSNNGPIWLVGTSMGTISVTTAALQLLNPRIKGVVLTASITNYVPGNLMSQRLDGIKLPVLMIHHEADACFVCVPDEARELFKRFTNSTSKEFLMVNGGGPVSGDPCNNQHWHGFVGIESRVTSRIVSWIKGNS